MPHFIRQNGIFVASALSLAVLIGAASLLSQKGELVYEGNAVPAVATQQAVSVEKLAAASAPTSTNPVVQQVRKTVIVAHVISKPSALIAVQPAARHRLYDDERGDDN